MSHVSLTEPEIQTLVEISLSNISIHRAESLNDLFELFILGNHPCIVILGFGKI